jgi:putative acetyltransferase
MHELRRYTPADLEAVQEAYRDAVQSQAAALYQPQQVAAWAHHGASSGAVRECLERGYGLVNPLWPGSTQIAAFAVLEPADRLALLYCRGGCNRQGRGSALLAALESRARHSGCRQLRTEASQLSRPLLLRCGWQIEAEETVLFAGVSFCRWRMIKALS